MQQSLPYKVVAVGAIWDIIMLDTAGAARAYADAVVRLAAREGLDEAATVYDLSMGRACPIYRACTETVPPAYLYTEDEAPDYDYYSMEVAR